MSQERKSRNDAEQLTLLPEGSPASRSVLPESRAARMMTATSGQKCYESFGKLHRLGSLLKTYLASSVLRSTMYLLTWKPKATPRSRLYYQLMLSVPRTGVTGYGLLATPNTLDGLPPKSPEALEREATVARPGRSKPANLRDQVVSMGLWPTPRASMTGSVHPNRSQDKFNNLESAVSKRLWPTPRASDSEGGKASIIPGTTTRISKAGTKRVAKLADIHGSGKLNPEWVEWLMGLPTGWTDLECLATAKSFRQRNGSERA